MSEEKFARIRRLWRDQPAEPFRDRPRRPNGYRDSPEYIRWQSERVAWPREMNRLYIAGAAAPASADCAAVLMYGVPLPGLRLERQPDGVILGDADGGAPAWFQTLELPAHRERVDRWLRRNRKRYCNDNARWRSRIRAGVQRFERDYIRTGAYSSPEWDARLRRLEAEWAESLRALADYWALAALRNITGPVEYSTIAEHNIAVRCRGALRELNRANPGVAGWWLGCLRREHIESRPEPSVAERSALPSQLPTHPGEIIALVKEHFRRVGGRHWKNLTRQPAWEMHYLTSRRPAADIAWVVDRASQLPADPAPPGPGRQASLGIKRQLVYLLSRIRACQQNGAPEHAEAVQALERVAHLLIRSGQAQFELQYALDYAMAEPAAARRRGSWPALMRAAAQWHEQLTAGNYQRFLAGREGSAEASSRPDLAWRGALTEYADADFRARLLASSGELRAETDLMRHCAGQSGYDYRCARGELRIFHLEPQGLDAGDKSERRRQATTVALERGAGDWQVSQQSGFANRKVSPREAAWGRRLAQAYNRAERRESAAQSVA